MQFVNKMVLVPVEKWEEMEQAFKFYTKGRKKVSNPASLSEDNGFTPLENPKEKEKEKEDKKGKERKKRKKRKWIQIDDT